jgi:hypothetical protein
MASFQELLIVFSVSIFALTLYLILTSEKKLKDNIKIPRMMHSTTFSKLLYRIHCSLVLLFIIVSVYSVWFGSRPSVYFVVFGLLFVTSTFLILATLPGKNAYAVRIVLLTVVILSLTQSMIPAIENRLMISGPDQWRDILATKLITDEGNFEHAAAVSGVYYSSIPLFSMLNAAVTLLIGNVYLSFAVLTGIMGLVMALSIYLILWKLTTSHLASVVGVFAFLSIPRLAMDQAIPSTLSLALGSLLILMLINYISVPRRRTLLAVLLIAFSTLIFHPVGIVVLIVLCGAFVLAFLAGVVNQKYPEAKIMLGLLVLICTMSFAFWSLSDITVFTSMITPLERLITSVPTSLGPSIYLPRYFLGGLEIYSFAWALPVGMSAAYVTSILYMMLTKKVKQTDDGETKFAFIAGTIGLFMIVVAFISVIHAPSASVERYVNNVAYLLLLLPTGVVCSRLIDSRRKIATVCLLVLLGVFVFIGSGSPDWAPSENPTFTIAHATYTSYVEAQTMANFLPNNPLAPVLIYDDHDIAVGGVASLANISISGPGTNQITRNVLDSIKDGTFDPFGRTYGVEIFIVRRDEIQNTTVINQYMNILYDSGRHVMIRTP